MLAWLALAGFAGAAWASSDGMPPLDAHSPALVEGLVASVLAMVMFGWLVYRSFTPLFPPYEAGAQWFAEPERRKRERLAHFSRWFIQMRWIACFVAFLLILIAVRVLGLLPRQVFAPLLASAGAAVALNLVYFLRLRKGLNSVAMMRCQVYGDLAVLMALLHFSGGIENPLCFFFVFHIIISGILLSRRDAFRVAAAAFGLVFLLAVLEWAHLLAHYTFAIFPHAPPEAVAAVRHAAHKGSFVLCYLLLQSVVLFLTAYFITTIMEQLRGEQQQTLDDRMRLEEIVDATGAALLILDRDLRVVWYGDRLRDWLGLGAGFPAAARPKIEAWVRSTIDPARPMRPDGRPRVTERFMEMPDGERRYFQVTTAVFHQPGGGVRQFAELIQETTDQKRVQRQLMQAGKLAAIGELAGNIAHEINNPVGIISGKCRLLLSEPSGGLSARVRAELEKITHLADRIGNIARGVLTYSRPSTGMRSRMDLRGPIRKAIGLLDHTAAKRDIRVDCSFPEPWPDVKANANEMEQTFMNLLVNAIDAMPGGGRLTVAGRVEPTHDLGAALTVAVAVGDTGVGIPDHQRDRIFDPFFTTKSEGHGTGLGLAISLGIVRSHGGTLDFTSAIGKGTTFTVRLPVWAEEGSEGTHGAGTNSDCR